MSIDIGIVAIDRPSSRGSATFVNKGNPANQNGRITSVKIYAQSTLANCEVATFYRPDPENYPNNLSTRDTHAIGAVPAGSEQSFEVNLEVQKGDYIGIYTSSGNVDVTTSGGKGIWYWNADDIPCTNQLFGTYANEEMSLYGIGVCVNTLTPTDILATSILANGDIPTIDEEDATTRGFKYGLTKTDTWDVHEAEGYEAGEYSLAIENLTANTTYFVMAYAIYPTVGTFYGEWIQFQTAATGTMPTGTKFSICSDYSGMTYILNESLTDDGNTYESYFVLSTDLAEKQGLHIEKRLEDIFSYFEKKDSGTCKIYVKRDNETTWQYAGEISMEGDADIIVKHLPSENQDSEGDVDFLAKHFLIKFVFENDFDFIGLITEFVPIGV